MLILNYQLSIINSQLALLYRPHNPGHDYYDKGIYLITLVVGNRDSLLGELSMDERHPSVCLTSLGSAVMDEWHKTAAIQASKGRNITLHAAVCMPDHFHGVIEVGERMDKSLGAIIQYFKSACTVRYRELTGAVVSPSWGKKISSMGKEQRAIAGLSMGGGGSVGYAMSHPDLFAACYAMSAWLNGEKRDNVDANDKMGLLNNAVADHYPVTILERADEQQLNALRSLRWFIDCGDDDFLFDQNIEFYKALRMRRFNAQLRVRDGGHNWEYWHNALRLCLPFVSRAMGK